MLCEQSDHDENAVRDAEFVIVLEPEERGDDPVIEFWCEDCRERVIFGTGSPAVAQRFTALRPLANHRWVL